MPTFGRLAGECAIRGLDRGGGPLAVPGVGVHRELDQFMVLQAGRFVRQGRTFLSENYATAERHLDVKVSTSFGGLAVEWID
jgi:hypothetical protein